jgi:hypothetical protein
MQYQFGFYRVGSEIFTHKASALIRATQLGVSPTWHFHSETYAKLNWKENVSAPLNFYYQERAKQLRNKYEYLILSFSGGSDSWTMLKAFVDSGTHLDEIYIRWPIEATYKKYNLGTDICPENIIGEWEFNMVPMINEYKKLLPNTKFEIHDFSHEIVNAELQDQDWLVVQDCLNPGVHFCHHGIGTSELDAMNAGKNTCIIYGIDKPQFWYDNGQVYYYFIDKLANNHPNNLFKRTCELFYWTPELPELVLAQARAVFQYLQANPMALNLIDRTVPYTPERKHIWDTILRHIIYSDYMKLNTFQAKKPTSSIHDEADAWLFWDHADSKLIKSWEYGIKNLLTSIDKKYFQSQNGRPTGFTGFVDGLYHLGDIRPEVDH